MKSTIKSILCAVLVPVVLVSCGGGGGGTSAPAGVTYTGSTAPATVTTANAVALAENALLSGGAGSAIPVGATTDTQDTPALAGLTHTLSSTMLRVKPQRSSSSIALGAQVSDSDTIPGTFGGSLSYAITFDDVTGQFSGSFSFNNLNEGDGIINGSASISGSLNPSTGDLYNITLNIARLTYTDGMESLTMGGSISITFTNFTTATFSMTMNFIDGNTQYRIQNFQMTVNSGSSDVITISGRFYHSVHGYIEVSTPTALNVALGANYPNSGVMLITGSNNSRARVTFTSATTFMIEVDGADADSLYELSGTCTWGTNCNITTPAPV